MTKDTPGESKLPQILSTDWHQQLSQLVQATCQYPTNTPQRRLGFNRIVRMIQKSGKVWWENQPYYEDALQDTWFYFSRNLCEGETNTAKPFCEKGCAIMARFNTYLKWRLQDYATKARKERNQRLSPRVSKEGGTLDPLNLIPAPAPVVNLCEKLRDWAEADTSDKLRKTHVRGRPDINCQVLILKRLPPEIPWKVIAAEFEVSISTLSGFYEKKCRPLLKYFCQSEGHI